MISPFAVTIVPSSAAPSARNAVSLSERPLIATSLAPRNLPRQQAAVASWRAQGFDVVSINCAEEIAQLTEHFPAVNFRVATSDARLLTGKPLVPLNDLLAALRAENRAVSGIVNSDIVLKPSGSRALSSWLKQTLGEGVAFAKRLDQETEFSSGVRYDGGIDVFFFGREVLFAYPSTPYFMGLPWWDYFFAAFAILAKFPTIEISEPIAFHLNHPSFYDPQKHWVPLGIDTLRLLSPLLEDNARLVSVSGMDAALKGFQTLASPSLRVNQPSADARAEHPMEEALLHTFMHFAHATIQLIEAGARPDRMVAPALEPTVRLRLGIPIIADASLSSGVQVIVDLVKALSRLPPAERPELNLVIPADQAHVVAEYAALFALVDQIIEVGFPDVGRRHAKLLVVADIDQLFEHIDFLYPLHMTALPGKPAATWIPDFQHHWLPKQFSDEERATRERRYRDLAAQADFVVLNSHMARRDWRQFYPNAHAVVRVLPFGTVIDPASLALDPAAVAAKHGIREPFLLCSNPFLIHKGHATLVEAIARLAHSGKSPLVVCTTGSLDDPRASGLLRLLRARIESAGLSERFRILGPVARDERIALMRQSLAVVQPSWVESWSTVVEEARALGKTIVLTDIDTHREQAPPRAHFYRVDDPGQLAWVLGELLPTLSPGPSREQERQAHGEVEEAGLCHARAVCALAREAAAFCAPAQKAVAISLAGPT